MPDTLTGAARCRKENGPIVAMPCRRWLRGYRADADAVVQAPHHLPTDRFVCPPPAAGPDPLQGAWDGGGAGAAGEDRTPDLTLTKGALCH